MTFTGFQYKFGFASKERRLNIRPLGYFFVKWCGFTIPDFVVEILGLSLMFFAGHHAWVLEFRLLKWEKVILIQ